MFIKGHLLMPIVFGSCLKWRNTLIEVSSRHTVLQYNEITWSFLKHRGWIYFSKDSLHQKHRLVQHQQKSDWTFQVNACVFFFFFFEPTGWNDHQYPGGSLGGRTKTAVCQALLDVSFLALYQNVGLKQQTALQIGCGASTVCLMGQFGKSCLVSDTGRLQKALIN